MHDVAILFDLGGAFDIALPLCKQADQRAIQAINLRPQSRHIGTGGGRKGWGFGHGGLASYGPDYFAQGVQAAGLVAKILRGARPSDVPVEGADRIELAVNLKTAELIGITLPRKVMLRAETFRR